MSSAENPQGAAPPKKRLKKFIVIGAVASVLLVGAGVGALMLMQSRAQSLALEEGEEEVARGDSKRNRDEVPTFVPLDPFTVNLADRTTERFAQVGITLEMKDADEAKRVKTYMPAIRHNILMVLAERTAAELTAREGKLELASQIRRETARALGIAVAEAPKAGAASAAGAAPAASPPPPARKNTPDRDLPVVAVHFSNFIIQ